MQANSILYAISLAFVRRIWLDYDIFCGLQFYLEFCFCCRWVNTAYYAWNKKRKIHISCEFWQFRDPSETHKMVQLFVLNMTFSIPASTYRVITLWQNLSQYWGKYGNILWGEEWTEALNAFQQFSVQHWIFFLWCATAFSDRKMYATRKKKVKKKQTPFIMVSNIWYWVTWKSILFYP